MTTNVADMQKDSYNYDLWRQLSITSTKSPTKSLSGNDSLHSYESSENIPCSPSIHPHTHPSIASYDTNSLSQLLDDLSIIDEVYQTFNDEADTGPYEAQFVNAAKNVAQKQFAVQQMCLSEDQYIADLENSLFYYLEPIERWVQDSSQNNNIFNKHSDNCSKQSLIDQFEITKEITKAHEAFYRGLKERIEIWGPTQFISDIFGEFYEKLPAYKRYVDNFSGVILTLDVLYRKSSSFCKIIDECASKTQLPSFKNFFTYLKIPMLNFSRYHSYVTQLVQATEASHPDYRSLLKIEERYAHFVGQLNGAMSDRIGQIRVLEAFRSIHNSPICVSPTRRLYISGLLTKVDLSNPHSLTDTRLYLLYNDTLIYCQKIKHNHHNTNSSNNSVNNNHTKMYYKGTIRLKQAEVKMLSPKSVAKMTAEVKKPFAFMIRKASSESKTPEQRQANIVAATPTVYGFEIHTTEYLTEGGTGIWSDSAYAIHHNGSGNTKRIYTMRTQDEAEQNAWITLLRRTIDNVSIKKVAGDY